MTSTTPLELDLAVRIAAQQAVVGQPEFVAERCEPVAVEIVEDELLLAMPFVSYHDPGECSGKQSYESTSDDVKKALAEEEKENPFNVLAQLKTDD